MENQKTYEVLIFIRPVIKGYQTYLLVEEDFFRFLWPSLNISTYASVLQNKRSWRRAGWNNKGKQTPKYFLKMQSGILYIFSFV